MSGDASGNLLLVQSFSQGSLFPTQGDAGVLPYTVILWGAADRGFFFVDQAGGSAGVVAAETVIAAIEAAGEPPFAVLIAPAPDANGTAPWALRLGYGALGSDPDAVTYQGEPLAVDEAATLLGMAPADPPDVPLDLGTGYFVIAGLPAAAVGATSLSLLLR